MKKVIVIFIVALIAYCITFLNLEAPHYLVDTIFYGFLTSESLKRLIDGLSLSLMAACIFYIIIDFMPRNERKKIAENFMKKQASVVLHAYKEAKYFAHEMSAKSVPDEFNEQWLKEQINILSKEEPPDKKDFLRYFLRLKFAVETAHRQKNEMEAIISIAANVSEDHAVEWLNLYTKLKLLASEIDPIEFEPFIFKEYYDDRGGLSFEEKEGKKSLKLLILSVRRFRMLEYCEACLGLLHVIKRK